MAENAKRGRPTDYTPEIAARICDRLASGESLRTIVRDDDMPGQTTVYGWLLRHDDFAKQYARARELQADALFDETLEIADDARNDWMVKRGEDDAGWIANGEHIQRSRLRIDARKWMAGKLRPKVYGDKVTSEVTGNEGGPLTIEIVRRVIDPKANAS